MKSSIFIFPILGLLFTGCVSGMINESTQKIHQNRYAVEASTQVIRENQRMIANSTETIRENKRLLDTVRDE